MNIDYIRNAFHGHQCEPIREFPIIRASVLLPFVETDGEPSILFEERNANIPQGGEVCFPGGHVEDGETPEDTALRETAEELQLEPEQIELIAPLHVLAGARGREIHSFLGVLHDYKGAWEAAEVSRTITVPLSWFRGNPPEIYKTRLLVSAGEDFPYELIPGGRDYPFAVGQENVYFYRTPEGVIWGLTAKLLYHFLELLGGLNNAWRDYRRHRRFPL